MYEGIMRNIERLQEEPTAREREATGIVIHEMLGNFDLIMDKGNNNIQNSPDNPRLPSVEILSEMCREVSDQIRKSKTQNSSMDYANAEVINVPSDSDDDRDYYYDTFNLNDISIIEHIKTVANDAATSSFSIDASLAGPSINLQTQAPAVASSGDSQVTSNSKIQDGPNAQVEENNNGITCTKTVSGTKRLSESPKPGCSRDSDDTSPKLNDDSPNLDELLKDARLIHALLPRFTIGSIYRKIRNNQSAKNRIELTLWDMLPVERPIPQFLRKRKSLDNVCLVDRKKSLNICLQEEQVNTETGVEKKEQRVTVGDVGKLEDGAFASSTGEIDGMKKVVKVVALNDKNNDIDQRNAISLKKTKTLDEHGCIEHGENINTYTMQDSKKPVSSEADSNTKESQSTKKSEVEKKPESFFDNIRALPVKLQPAKITFELTRASQKMRVKPPAPILTPPKLQFFRNPTIYSAQTISSNAMQIKLDGPTVPSVNLNSSANDSSATWLPNTSSNDKRASRTGDVSQRPSLPWPKPAIIRNVLDLSHLSKNMETQDSKSSEVYATEVLKKHFDRWFDPLNTVENPQNISDYQRASSSKACNFYQEVGNTSFASSQGVKVYPPRDRADEKQQNVPVDILYIGRNNVLDTVTNIVEDTASKSDYKEVKTDVSKETCIEKNAKHKKIILNNKANEMYVKLISMFPSVKTHFIKQLCHDFIKDDLTMIYNDEVIMENLVDRLLNCDQENQKKIKILPVFPAVEKSAPYDINDLYIDLLMIFPEADPVYLRKMSEEIHGNDERIKEFIQSKFGNPDYPTRAQYLAKKKITEQQKQYTTDFKVQQFLQIFPDPFSYFEDDKRNCQFNPHAIDFLKYYFSQLRVNTLVKTYSDHMNNLSLTAKALEVLNSDLKSKRQCNKMILTENIPFLQECAFIQHKTALRKYLDEAKTKEEQEFNELKAKNALLECQCCYDDECMPLKCSTCEDGHVFCNSCIIRSTDVVLGEGNTRVDCLLKCGCEFPISVLQRVLPPTKFSILLCKRQEAEVIAAGVEGLVSCPFCHFASIPPPEDKIFKCLNPECMKESCRLCKELNHVPLKCVEKRTESARLYLEEKMTEALVRKCYRCNRMFFKEEGCNKMTCICGAQMCYICDKPVTNYNHFQGQGAERSNLCPLWSDDRRRNAESVIKVCEETVKQIKEKDPQININVDALLPKLPPKSKGPHENIVIPDEVMRQFPFG